MATRTPGTPTRAVHSSSWNQALTWREDLFQYKDMICMVFLYLSVYPYLCVYLFIYVYMCKTRHGRSRSVMSLLWDNFWPSSKWKKAIWWTPEPLLCLLYTSSWQKGISECGVGGGFSRYDIIANGFMWNVQMLSFQMFVVYLYDSVSI